MPKKARKIPNNVYDADVLAAVRSAVNLPDIRSSNVTRFRYGVKKNVETRAQNSWSTEDDASECAVFVSVARPRRPSEAIAEDGFVLEQVFDLPVNNQRIFGKVFFLGVAAFNGRSIDLPVQPNEIGSWLASVGLDEVPFAVAHKQSLKITFRDYLLDPNPSIYNIRTSPTEISIDKLKLALDDFHLSHVLTPTACRAHVWQKGLAGQYIPGSAAEAEIQSKLGTVLGSWFQGQVTVHMENPVITGRIDIQLLVNSPDPNLGKAFWAVIELKVLKTYNNTDDVKTKTKFSEAANVSAVIKGFEQADSFARQCEIPEGFLEIFDMRKVKNDILKITKVIAAQNRCKMPVNIGFRDIYGSADDARKAGH